MKKGKDFVKDFSKNLIHRMVKNDSAEWPPNCAVFAYQPVRPCQKKARDNQTEHTEEDGTSSV